MYLFNKCCYDEQQKMLCRVLLWGIVHCTGTWAAISHQVKEILTGVHQCTHTPESYFWVTQVVSTATTGTMKRGLLYLVLRLLQSTQSAVKFTLTQKSPPIRFSWRAIKPCRPGQKTTTSPQDDLCPSLSRWVTVKKKQQCFFFWTTESSRELRAIATAAAVKHDGRLIGK